MLRAAVGAASFGDHVEVRDYLSEYNRATELTGDHKDSGLRSGDQREDSPGMAGH